MKGKLLAVSTVAAVLAPACGTSRQASSSASADGSAAGGSKDESTSLRADDRPDIIFIMTDQQTLSAMSCMGNPALRTPVMDRLAADGVLFTKAYCPFPLSGPCRASLITGVMPVECGATDNGVRPASDFMDNGIGHRLSAAGYDCQYAGKWHVPEVNLPDNAGFRKLCDMEDGEIAQACRKGIESRDPSKPLFLVASYLDPHEICEFARDESLPNGQLPAFDTSVCPQLPDNFNKADRHPEALDFERNAFIRSHDTFSYSEDDWRRYMYGYYRLVERVDKRIGELLEVLDSAGLYDNALIVFTSDHGDGVAAHGWNQKWALYEECINVPLIIKAPAASPSASPSSAASASSSPSAAAALSAASLSAAQCQAAQCPAAQPRLASAPQPGDSKYFPPRRVGVVDDSTLSNIGLDIYATICDYARVSLDTAVYRGVSLRNALYDVTVSPAEAKCGIAATTDRGHEYVVCETYLSAIGTRGWSITDGRWKYVIYQHFQNREGLFDLAADKGEMHNLSREEAGAQQLMRLRAELYAYALRARDPKLIKQLRPLVEGTAETPSGALSGHVKGNYR